MFKNSVELLNHINGLEASQKTAMEANDTASAHRLQGEIDARKADLANMVAAEADARNAGTPEPKPKNTASLGERVFGPRNEFTGVAEGFTAVVKNEVGPVDNPLAPADPTVTDPKLPGSNPMQRPLLVDVLYKGTTEGAATQYFVRDMAQWDSKAAQWKTGTKKRSNIAWTPEEAKPVTFAHYIPIAKRSAQHHSELVSLVNGELMLGLNMSKSEDIINSTEAAGKVKGLFDFDLISHTPVVGDNIYDTIRRMVTVSSKAWMRPTHVVMTSEAKEALDLLKGDDGHYLLVGDKENPWGLTVIVDDGMLTTDGDGAEVHRVMVFTDGAAEYRESESNNVTVGLVANQFIENAYTMLGECEGKLIVRHPESFVYAGLSF